MNHYFVVVASPVSEHLEDPISGFFFENGAEGISEKLDFKQLDSQYNVETQSSDHKILNIYFSERPNENLLFKAASLFSEVHFEIEQQENKDWMHEWKKGFHSFALAPGVQVVPSWEKPQSNSDLKIFIDPGMAFGTGTHATTQIAAEALSTLSLQGLKVLDVGTGTAILAILCEMKGASLVHATEIEDIAREVAKENILLNSCKKTVILNHQIEEVSSPLFDVVIANIIDGVLINIQKDLSRCTSPAGYLILTGILEERETHFLNEFDLSLFTKVSRWQKDEWVGFLLQKVPS